MKIGKTYGRSRWLWWDVIAAAYGPPRITRLPSEDTPVVYRLRLRRRTIIVGIGAPVV